MAGIGAKLLGFIFSGVVSGVFIWNTINYNKIVNAGGTAGITKGQAESALYVNVALAIISLLVFLYSVWLLLTSDSQRNVATKRADAYLARDTGLLSNNYLNR